MIHIPPASMSERVKITLFVKEIKMLKQVFISGEFDAEQCHLDCQKQGKSDFAKECREGGGVFKCCIR